MDRPDKTTADGMHRDWLIRQQVSSSWCASFRTHSPIRPHAVSMMMCARCQHSVRLHGQADSPAHLSWKIAVDHGKRLLIETIEYREKEALSMALYAFDGTWNVDEADEIKETNVLAFCKCLPLDMRVFYLEGVGSRLGFIGKLLGGLAGAGGRFRIARAMEQLNQFFAEGDRTVDIIGFSRGAAIALHFANQVQRRSQEPKSASSVFGTSLDASAFQEMI